jgi:hypothetical protein
LEAYSRGGRVPQAFVVFGFASTHEALDAEALLGDVGIDVVPIPAPASISATCGIALRLLPADELRALEYLLRAGILVAARSEIEDI